MGVRSWRGDQFRAVIFSVCVCWTARSWKCNKFGAVIFLLCVGCGCKEPEMRSIYASDSFGVLGRGNGCKELEMRSI